MKIELIKQDKVKVQISPDDLSLFGISPDTIKPDSPELQKFLFKVLENVERETGFNPRTGQVVMEACHSKAGLLLTITKLRSAAARVSEKPRAKKHGAALKIKNINKQHTVYKIKSFDDLCAALVCISEETLHKSRLYIYNDSYYFVNMRPYDGGERDHLVLCEFCSDYGSNTLKKDFLAEHAEKLAAGESLASMAAGLRGIQM